MTYAAYNLKLRLLAESIPAFRFHFSTALKSNLFSYLGYEDGLCQEIYWQKYLICFMCWFSVNAF